MSISRRSFAGLLMGATLMLAGCDGFFDKTSDDGGDTGTGTGNYLYVGNTGSKTVSGYQISTTGTLTAITGSPVSISDGTNTYTPTALTVTRSNTYLYVGTTAGIFGFKIGTAGALSKVASGQILQQLAASSLETSPDGKWLIALGQSIASPGSVVVASYSIASDGTISVNNSSAFLSSTATLHEVHILPKAGYIYATVGTDGTLIYKFNTSTGVVDASPYQFNPITNATGDNSLAITSDSSKLYLARSGTNSGLTLYTIGNDGRLTQSATYSAGNQPYSVVMDNAGKYVYVANKSDSTISGYSVGTNGVLTTMPSSPFSAGSAVTALGAEAKGNYILSVAASGTPDVAMYGFDTSTANAGRLYSVASATAGTTPSMLALTHPL